MSNKPVERISIPPMSKVSRDCRIEGNVQIGSFVVIHPKVQIKAIGGPIIIGNRCMIEDRCRIVCPEGCPKLEIGKHNQFHIGTRIEGCQKIGDFNDFGENCRIGPNVESIGTGCTIGPQVQVTQNVPDNTSLFNVNNRLVIREIDQKDENQSSLKTYSDLIYPTYDKVIICRRS